MKDFKYRLKELIKNRGLTVADFAMIMDQKPSTVYSWLAPGRTHPKIQDLAKIASILDTTCEYLLTGNKDFLLDMNSMKEIIELQKEVIKQLSSTITKIKNKAIHE